jgi:endonuclease/exonuclease/phosphatase (EEP) superfamily protein YafD
VQIEEILADTRRYLADAPILIAGDFNTWRTSTPVVAALLKAGFDFAVGNKVTTPRGSALDWIFVQGPLCSRRERYTAIPRPLIIFP